MTDKNNRARIKTIPNPSRIKPGKRYRLVDYPLARMYHWDENFIRTETNE